MNCKPGDLAVLVDSDFEENIGGLVLVICVADPQKFVPSPDPVNELEWECELLTQQMGWDDAENYSWSKPGDRQAIYDRYLRPIRDNDGEDETLTWAGKPQCEPA